MMERLFRSMQFLVIFLSFVGCTRTAQNGPTKLVLQTPATGSSQKLSSQGTVTEPTSLNDINCYGVLISGPTDEMRRNSCGTKGVASSRFAVGKWLMMVPSGSEIAIDVPSGFDREVILVGAHATNGACVNLGSEIARTSDISKPYILGKVSGIEMKAGATVEVNVPMSFNSQSNFDDCSGPDFQTGVFDPNRPGPGNGGTVPTQIRIDKADFPEWRFRESACNFINLNLQDATGRQGSLANPVSGQIYVNGSPVNLYSDPNQCASQTGGLNVFTIPPHSSWASFAFMAPSSSSSPTITVNASVTNTPVALAVMPLSSMTNGPNTGNSFMFDGPNRFLPGICYPSEVKAVSINGSYNYASGSVSINGDPGLSFYSDVSCSTAASSFTWTGSYPSKASFYFKVAPGFTGFISASQAGYETALKRIEAGSGTVTLASLQFYSNPTISASVCQPFLNAWLYNDQGTAVPAPVGGISISFSGLPSGGVYSDDYCSAGPLNPAVIPAGETWKSFKGNFSGVGQYNFTITPPIGSPLNRTVIVDGIYKLGLSGPSSVQNPGTCVALNVDTRTYMGAAINPNSSYNVTLMGGRQMYGAIGSLGECIDPISSITLNSLTTPYTIYVEADNLAVSQGTDTITASAPGLQNAQISLNIAGRPPLSQLWPIGQNHFIPAEYPLNLLKVITRFTGVPSYSFTKQSGAGALTGANYTGSPNNDASQFTITDSAAQTLSVSTTTVAHNNLHMFTTTMPSGFTLARSSNGTYYDASGTLVSASPGIARFDHFSDPATSYAPRGLLIEGSATNLIPYSSNFSSWTIPLGQVQLQSIPSVTAPDGTSLSTGLINVPNDIYNMPQVISSIGVPVSGKRYTASIFVKYYSSRFVGFKIHEDGTNYGHAGVVMDLTSGAFVGMNDPWSSDQPISFGREILKNGWYRLWVSYVSKGGSGLSAYIYPAYHDGITLSPNRVIGVSGGNYFWGAQLEDSSMMTSYIPTIGATATRLNETLTATTTSVFSGLAYSGTVRLNYELHDGKLLGSGLGNLMYMCGLNCNADSIKIYIDSFYRPQSQTTYTGMAQEYLNLSRPSPRGVPVRTAFGFTNTTQRRHNLVHEGHGRETAPSTSDTWTTPNLFTSGSMGIGNSAGGTNPVNMHLLKVEFWPQRLSLPAAESMTEVP